MHHGAGLRRALEAGAEPPPDPGAWVAALAADHTQVALDPAERAMLDYAVKLTRTPSAVGAEDVAALRATGHDDRAIHDVCAITAYFAFVNRIADGLGVELEPDRAG